MISRKRRKAIKAQSIIQKWKTRYKKKIKRFPEESEGIKWYT